MTSVGTCTCIVSLFNVIMHCNRYSLNLKITVWWSHHHASVLWGGISVIMWQQLSFMGKCSGISIYYCKMWLMFENHWTICSLLMCIRCQLKLVNNEWKFFRYHYKMQHAFLIIAVYSVVFFHQIFFTIILYKLQI